MMVSKRTLPASSACATVNGLSTEPGSKVSVIARLRSCAPDKRSRLFGLYVGQLASARISPVLASTTTAPPALALKSLTACLSWL